MVGLQGSTVACFRCSCDVCPALSSVFRKLPLVTCIFTVCLYTEIHLASQFTSISLRLFCDLQRFLDMGSRCFTHYFIFPSTYHTPELSSFMISLQGSTVACFRCSCNVCPALSSVFRKLPLVTCIFTVCLYTEIHLASQFPGIVLRLFYDLQGFLDMGSRCFTHYFIFSITYYTAELSSFMVGLQGSTVACFCRSCNISPGLSSIF